MKQDVVACEFVSVQIFLISLCFCQEWTKFDDIWF